MRKIATVFALLCAVAVTGANAAQVGHHHHHHSKGHHHHGHHKPKPPVR